MSEVKEKVDRLEYMMMELSYTQMKTQMDIHSLSKEMKEFKNEMKEFKNEMKRTVREMNLRWGDLANKMGTIVEDIVVPNIHSIAGKYFGCKNDFDDFMVNRKKKNIKDPSKHREFDVIAVFDEKVILNETKSTVGIKSMENFIEFIKSGEFFDYFPEYKDKELIPVLSSLYISEDVVKYLSKNKIYALAMKEETMDLLNPEIIQKTS